MYVEPPQRVGNSCAKSVPPAKTFHLRLTSQCFQGEVGYTVTLLVGKFALVFFPERVFHATNTVCFWFSLCGKSLFCKAFYFCRTNLLIPPK